MKVSKFVECNKFCVRETCAHMTLLFVIVILTSLHILFVVEVCLFTRVYAGSQEYQVNNSFVCEKFVVKFTTVGFKSFRIHYHYPNISYF